MANFKLTQTGAQIQADLDLLDKNSATQGQVLTANGTGGASWQNASGGTTVEANPTLAGTEADLTGLAVNGTKYKVPSGGGGTQLYVHDLELEGISRQSTILNNVPLTDGIQIEGSGGRIVLVKVYSTSSSPVEDISKLIDFIFSDETVSIKCYGETMSVGMDFSGEHIVLSSTLLCELENDNGIKFVSYTIVDFTSDTVTPL